jgi:hypothetical protein
MGFPPTDTQYWEVVAEKGADGTGGGGGDRLVNGLNEVVLDSDGNITLPNGMTIDSYGTAGLNAIVTIGGDNTRIIIDNDGAPPGFSIVTDAANAAHTWRFGPDGDLSFPNGKIKAPISSNISIETEVPKSDPPTTIVISGADFTAVNLTYTKDGANSIWYPAGYNPSNDPYIEFTGGGYGIRVPGFNQALYVNTGSLNEPLAQWDTNPPLGSVAPTGVYTYPNAYTRTWTFDPDGKLTLPAVSEINTKNNDGLVNQSIKLGGGDPYLYLTNYTNPVLGQAFTTADWATAVWDGTSLTITDCAGFITYINTATTALVLRINGSIWTETTGRQSSSDEVTFQNLPINTATPVTVTRLDVYTRTQASLAVEGDTVAIFAPNDNYWSFDGNGKLTLPEGGDIVDSNGDSVLGGGGGSGGVVERSIEFPQGEEGDTAGTLALNPMGSLFICKTDWVDYSDYGGGYGGLETSENFLPGQTGFVSNSVTILQADIPQEVLYILQNVNLNVSDWSVIMDDEQFGGEQTCTEVNFTGGDLSFNWPYRNGTDPNGIPEGSGFTVAYSGEVPQPAIWEQVATGSGLGDLTVENGDEITNSDGNITLNAEVDILLEAGDDLRLTADDQVRIRTRTDTVNIITNYDSPNNGDHVWRFGDDGNLTLPGNILKTTGVSITVGESFADVYVREVDELVPPGGVWRLFIYDSDYPTLGATVQVGDTVTMGWGGVLTATITEINQLDGDWQIQVDQDITPGFNEGPQRVSFSRSSINTWTFGIDGGLTFSDGSVQTTAFTVQSTEIAPENGKLWFNPVEGRMYVEYNGQWVDASPTVLAPPDVNPTVESLTFNDATVQTTAWPGTLSYNDLTDKPVTQTFVGGGGASTWLTAN